MRGGGQALTAFWGVTHSERRARPGPEERAASVASNEDEKFTCPFCCMGTGRGAEAAICARRRKGQGGGSDPRWRPAPHVPHACRCLVTHSSKSVNPRSWHHPTAVPRLVCANRETEKRVPEAGPSNLSNPGRNAASPPTEDTKRIHRTTLREQPQCMTNLPHRWARSSKLKWTRTGWREQKRRGRGVGWRGGCVEDEWGRAR